ncbi:hypothetical protein [Luteolibacter soli]|uniref:MoxR-vWA-beta-propeller ternary system domain-containing protein n=1 Tax=Luteolibacter soli TaxID=3135280 RepID=A0ABU9AXL1_9BACT
MTSRRTTNYAVPPEGHFWKWSGGHDAIEWKDGRTLALWPEIHTILDFIGNNSGVPPLGSVLLVLAACRDEWIAHRPLNHGAFRKALEIRDSDPIPPDSAEILITGLDVIHALPRDLRSSLAAKCHLVSALFEGGPYCLPRSESELVLRDLSVFGIGDTSQRKPEMDAKARLQRDLRALKTGLARHGAESLENLLRTGIENSGFHQPLLPSLAEDPIEPRLLLDHLISSGGESGAAAAVAKRAIAMMNFPGRFGAPLDLPVGGIADITNRGTIDRLLPGELAWDDLVLAARLVHNEALYFRREIPPQHVAVSHMILLDRGLRLWGTARVFSLGVALGLWHHPALNGPGEFLGGVAATTDLYETLDLSTPAGVRSALEVLLPAASPNAFLIAWWDVARIVDDVAIPDVSFITAKEHLEDATTRRLLGEIAGWIHERAGRFQVVAVDRLGNLEVQAWSPAGNHTLFHGMIDLAEILKPPTAEPLPKKPAPPPLRAQANVLHGLLPIYEEEQLPFLFPVIPQASAYLPDGAGASDQEGGMGVSFDHRLMRWPKPGWGALEVVPGKLPGRQHWLGRGTGDEQIVIASAEQAGGHVRAFNLRDQQLREIEIEPSLHAFPRHAAVSGGAVVLVYADRAEAFSLKSGRRVAENTVAKLPANPVVDFDGETIRVFDSGMKASLGLDGWSLRDSSWPRLISPDQISIEQGVLRLMCGSNVYQFNPWKLAWENGKAGPARFAAFKESDHSPASGVTLRVAQVGRLEAWLDSRGLLHLRQMDAQEPNQFWSILLSTPAASAWIPTHGLDSIDPRLMPPGTTRDQGWSAGLLLAFLKSNSASPITR